MPASGWEGPGEVRRLPGSGTHTLLAARSDQLTAGAATWIAHELAGGSKVLYTGWSGADGHWLLGPRGIAEAPRALARGQLEIEDFRALIERCGGTSAGLLAVQQDALRRATADGWSSVAMAQETTHRPMADDREVAEFARQERGYGWLAARWPLNTLCQLGLGVERPTAIWESIAWHHGDVEATGWSARTVGGRWCLAGELDVAVVQEFGAAVHGAFRAAADRPGGPDLHLDLGRVSFLDSACARILLLAARSAPRRQRLVVHRCPSLHRALLETVGLPRSVEFAPGFDGGFDGGFEGGDRP